MPSPPPHAPSPPILFPKVPLPAGLGGGAGRVHPSGPDRGVPAFRPPGWPAPEPGHGPAGGPERLHLGGHHGRPGPARPQRLQVLRGPAGAQGAPGPRPAGRFARKHLGGQPRSRRCRDPGQSGAKLRARGGIEGPGDLQSGGDPRGRTAGRHAPRPVPEEGFRPLRAGPASGRLGLQPHLHPGEGRRRPHLDGLPQRHGGPTGRHHREGCSPPAPPQPGTGDDAPDGPPGAVVGGAADRPVAPGGWAVGGGAPAGPPGTSAPGADQLRAFRGNDSAPGA